jgi:ATP-binding cassette, subfamily B, bacterial
MASRIRLWLGRLRQTPLIDATALAYLWTYFQSAGGQVALLAFLGILQSTMFLPALYGVRLAFNNAVPNGKVGLLIWIGLGLVLVRILHTGVALCVRAISLKITKAAICEMRRDLIAMLYALPHDFFGRNDAARLQTRIIMETERVDNFCSLLLSSMLPSALSSLCLLAALTYLNLWLVLALACFAPMMWFSMVLGGQHIKREVRSFQNAFESFSHGVQFVVRQMDLTRLRGYEDSELARQTEGLRLLESSGVRMAMSYALQRQVQANLIGMGGLVVLVGGGIAVVYGAMSLGDLLAFYLAAGMLNVSVSSLTAFAPELIAANESLSKLLELRGEVAAPCYQGKAIVQFNGNISLSTVDFAYDTPLLRGVSLDLMPARTTAIVGANGAGKSTVVSLVLGFYRPDSGRLTVEGMPYDAVDLRLLRQQIGVVMQKPTFFTGTIAENLRYGWPEVSRAELKRAVRQACADVFIASLPEGYDTIIGEAGALISGGEAQRLAIARALIGQPKLLILDEPTNHLDAETVGRIMRRITSEPGHATVLIISHDKEVVAFSDLVFRLENGILVRTDYNSQPKRPEWLEPRSVSGSADGHSV